MNSPYININWILVTVGIITNLYNAIHKNPLPDFIIYDSWRQFTMIAPFGARQERASRIALSES